jgi:Tol biopolymer transport system component
MSAEGGPQRRLTRSREKESAPSWSHDGKWVYFVSSGDKGESQVFKVAAGGGKPVQVTNNGGLAPLEGLDGFIYFIKNVPQLGEIWRKPITGGKELPVHEKLRAINERNYVVKDDGIYFISDQEQERLARIQFFDFRTRQVIQVASISAPHEGGFDISPDGQWLLVSQIDHRNADIMLMENFR